MCRQQDSNVLTWASTAPVATTPKSPDIREKGSRRRRLWELPQMCHCPVIGVCLPLDALRKIVQRHLLPKSPADDYDIHVAAVGHCDRRTPLSEQLHEELERRYQLVVRQYRQFRDEPALEEAWQAAVKNGEAAASLWAVLTHPQAGIALLERIIHTMHMLQHQAGAATRVDLAAYRALQQENQTLCESLRAETDRHLRQIAERDRRLEQAEQELARLRTEAAGKDSLIFSLKSTVADLHAVMPDAAGIKRVRAELDELRSYCQGLERRLRKEAQPAPCSQSAVAPAAEVGMRDLLPVEETAVVVERHLGNRTVLCVGGRVRSITEVRSLIEGAGGQFAYHDGGFENNLHQLDSTLAAADLVICQTGCISHNAYWRVKTHCKRTGKRCVFVEAPGRAGLLKHLNELAEVSPASSGESDL
jgi:hypothetical protein